MQIEQIITLANAKVRLDFLAMYRSLRNTGCDLPVRVIPFDDTRFDLPKGAEWLENPGFFAALKQRNVFTITRKLIAFTQPRAAFFDTDIVHLRKFDEDLAPLPENQLVVADPEWSLGKWTFTQETAAIYRQASSTWLLDNFNSGFFALGSGAMEERFILSCLEEELFRSLCQGHSPTKGEQAAANYLVFKAGLQVLNLCLPPYRMESTFCWDYSADYQNLLLHSSRRPFFLHFVSKAVMSGHFLKDLFFQYLSQAEIEEWHRLNPRPPSPPWPLSVRLLNRLVALLDKRFYVQPRPRNPA